MRRATLDVWTMGRERISALVRSVPALRAHTLTSLQQRPPRVLDRLQSRLLAVVTPVRPVDLDIDEARREMLALTVHHGGLLLGGEEVRARRAHHSGIREQRSRFCCGWGLLRIDELRIDE